MLEKTSIGICLLCNIIALSASSSSLISNQIQTHKIPADTINAGGVPNEFPTNNTEYNIITNSTILSNLNNHPKNDTEVSDLLIADANITRKEIHQKIMDIVNKKIRENATLIDFPKDDAELMQSGDNEDTREAARSLIEYNSHVPGAPMVQGQLAAICAGIFVVIAVMGYIGLLSWRRFLENRYGNREMLVNEEDMYDPNDMKHFSL